MIITVAELDEALQILTEHPAFADRLETIWNAGGAEIYRLGLTHPWTHKLLLTRIEHEYDADVFFPLIPWASFLRCARLASPPSSARFSSFLQDEYFENDDFKPIERVEEGGVTWFVESYTRKESMFGDDKENN